VNTYITEEEGCMFKVDIEVSGEVFAMNRSWESESSPSSWM